MCEDWPRSISRHTSLTSRAVKTPSLEDLLDAIPQDLHDKAASVLPRRIQRCLELLDVRVDGLVVASEAVYRRHNVSAILRSAEAFGLHEAHLITNAFQPSFGASKGGERWMELHFHESTSQWAAQMRSRGHAIYVADLAEEAFTPDTLPVDQPLAVLFGGELAGVSEEARELADGVVSVPMVGVTQSLNVSVAAAVVLNRLATRRGEVPGAKGIEGERREAYLRAFIEREWARKKSR